MHQQMEPQRSMGQRFVHHFVRLLIDSDFEYTEAQSPVAKTLWGLWLLYPAWDTFSGSRAYETMSKIAHESVWGLGLLLVGLVHLLAIVGNYHKARLWMALGGVVVWVAVAALFFQTAPASTGVPIYTLIAAGAAWSFLRLRARDDG